MAGFQDSRVTTVPPQEATPTTGPRKGTTLSATTLPSVAPESYLFDAATFGEGLPAPGLLRSEFKGAAIVGVRSDEKTIELSVVQPGVPHGAVVLDVPVDRGGRELLSQIQKASGAAFRDNSQERESVKNPSSLTQKIFALLPAAPREPEADGWKGTQAQITPGLVVDVTGFLNGRVDGVGFEERVRHYGVERLSFRVK